MQKDAHLGEHTGLLSSDKGLGRIVPRRVAPFVILVIVSKFLRALGLFVSYDLLQVVPLAQFLFLVYFGAACIFAVLQKPFSGKKVQPHLWPRLIRNAVVQCVITLIFTCGLTLCGPLRTSLVYDQSDLAVLALAAAVWGASATGFTKTKIRGCVLFILAVICLLLFDFDVHDADEDEHPEGVHHGPVAHVLYWVFSHLNLPDHKGGVLLMLLALFMAVGRRTAAKKLAVDIGGAKQLHAITTILCAVMFLPWAVMQIFAQHPLAPSVPWLSTSVPFIVVVFTVHIIDFYMVSMSERHLDVVTSSRLTAIASTTSALLAAYLWNSQPDAPDFLLGRWVWSSELPVPKSNHVLSGGVVFAYIFFLLAHRLLTGGSSRIPADEAIGGTPGGLLLYSGQGLQRRGQSVITTLHGYLRQILDGHESRQIFYYLCLNMVFTGVELVYGMWTNSLGLISDGFHMLFDCTALFVGLYAAIVSRWKATRTFSYGYGRVEVLSGFVNGLFLLMISCFILWEACERLFDPPHINTDRLLTVSIIGFAVNLVGMVAFSHAHTHGGQQCNHSTGSSHSHDSTSSSGHHHHEHGGGGSQKKRSANMQGVFLHVLADTLGSVGVIISSLLVEKFEWYIADPISSLLISVLITLSVLPLLKSSAITLLQGTDLDVQDELAHAIDEIKAVPGVVNYREAHGWQHNGALVCCTVHVQITDDTNEQSMVHQISSILKHRGFTEVAVQIEKEAFFRLAPAHITRSFCAPNEGHSAISPQAYVTYGPSGGGGGADPDTPNDAPEPFGTVVNV